jgi:hypothetical protein
MKLHNGRVISEDNADGRLEPTRISRDCCPTKAKDRKLNDGHYISHILSPLPEILAPYQDDPSRHFVIRAGNSRPYCAKPVTQFWITIPYAKHVILLIRQIWPH